MAGLELFVDGFGLRIKQWLALMLRMLIFLFVMVPALAATTVLMAVTNPSVLYVERRRVLLTYSWWNAWRWVRAIPPRVPQQSPHNER